MATNFIAVNTLLSKQVLKGMYIRLVALKTMDRSLDSQWDNTTNGLRQGDTYKINRPARFKSTVGDVIAGFDPVSGGSHGFTEDPIFLTVANSDIRNIATSFSSKDVTLALSDEKSRLAEPVGAQLANDIEQKIVGETITRGGQYVIAQGNSSLGTKIGTSDLLQAQAYLDAMTTDIGKLRTCLIPAFSMAQLSRENLNLFTPTVNNDQVYPSGYVKEFAGSDIYSYNLLPVYSVPAIFGPLTLTANVTDGASTVTFSAGANDIGEVLPAGTILEFNSYYVVNPATRQSVGRKYSFAITAPVTLAASNTVSIDSAALIYGPADAGNRQNITALPVIGDTVNVVGATQSTYAVTNTSGSAVISFAGAAASMVGAQVIGTGVPANATVSSVVAGTSITISAVTTANVTSIVMSQARSYDQVSMYGEDAFTATIIPLTVDLPGAYAARADYEGFSIRASVQTLIGSTTVVHRFDVFGKGILQRDPHAVRILVPQF